MKVLGPRIPWWSREAEGRTEWLEYKIPGGERFVGQDDVS